ncbi:MAG: hypothetical protein ACJ76H_12015, partial [Bacteriovoracaceae bacterium]
SVLAAISVFFIMRSVSIGHLLFPLGLNLFSVLLSLPEFSTTEFIILPVYGFFFVMNLALILPSEERFILKLKDWSEGKFSGLVRTFLFLAALFAIGYYFFHDLDLTRHPPVADKNEIQKHLKHVNEKRSAINSARDLGLLPSPGLLNQYNTLAKHLEELGASEKPLQEKFEKLAKKEESLESNYNRSMKDSDAPALTPELKDFMMGDLESRSSMGIDPDQFQKMQNLKEKLDKTPPGSGQELVKEYRALKYCDNGFYHEETEISHGPQDAGQTEKMEKIIKSAEKKKELNEELAKNISALKENPDEGLLQVNKALKNDLEGLDGLNTSDRQTFEKEIARSNSLHDQLKARTNDPAIQEKLDKIFENNRHLLNELSPHMKGEEKSEVAEKISKNQEELASLKKEVSESIARSLQEKQTGENQKKLRGMKVDQGEKKETHFNWARILKLILISAIAYLLYAFINKFMKKGVKKARVVPEHIREDIAEELRKLQNKKLSAREEVIETYNVLHDGLHYLVFEKETPPSCIVYEEMAHSEPTLDKPSFAVTEIYAKTFYGERDVSPEDLSIFRKNVRKIFSYFEISA